LPFQVAAPQYKESLDPGIAPELFVKHQALHKALSLKERYPDALIIGSDQVFVDARQRMLGKAGGQEQAVAQLMEMQGRKHTFYTGVAVYDSRSGEQRVECETYSVTLRGLSEEQVRNYVSRENPIDCAGSFKIEGLGVALMESMDGSDYTTLIGLPLICLVDMLDQFGVHVL
jgi:septum formation protein